MKNEIPASPETKKTGITVDELIAWARKKGGTDFPTSFGSGGSFEIHLDNMCIRVDKDGKGDIDGGLFDLKTIDPEAIETSLMSRRP